MALQYLAPFLQTKVTSPGKTYSYAKESIIFSINILIWNIHNLFTWSTSKKLTCSVTNIQMQYKNGDKTTRSHLSIQLVPKWKKKHKTNTCKEKETPVIEKGLCLLRWALYVVLFLVWIARAARSLQGVTTHISSSGMDTVSLFKKKNTYLFVYIFT